jgi:hypothetical protein
MESKIACRFGGRYNWDNKKGNAINVKYSVTKRESGRTNINAFWPSRFGGKEAISRLQPVY